MAKICSKCKRELDESNFNWKLKDVKLAAHCKDCSRRYIREHYKNNLQYYLNKAHKRNRMLRQKYFDYIGPYLASHPCIDCGEKDILVLEFDHRDRKNKDFSINSIVKNTMPIEKLIVEIAKCDVRCSNCHQRKTAKENNNWKLKYKHL